MIRLYAKNETEFGHNETVLQPIRCEVTEEENGQFELDYESLPTPEIEAGSIIEAPTPRGMQLFRVYKPTHSLRKTKAKGRHISYDLMNNWLEDVRPTATTGSGAVASILGGTLYPHRFSGSSTVATIATSYYVRKNPIQALIGADNALVSRWGGYLRRDNFVLEHIPSGRDLGYEIRHGKNLTGIEMEVDDSKVVTKLMPTWVAEENNVVQYLPEKYIDSPLIGAYPTPRVAEFRVSIPEGTADPAAYVRAEAQAQFSVHKVDQPLVNYKIDFVALQKLPEYKNYVWIEELDLYDIVDVIVDKMGIRISSSVIRYTYDSIKERYKSIEIGNFSNSLAKNTAAIVSQVDSKIEAKSEELIAKQLEATRKITGVTGGNVLMRFDQTGRPYETLWMDTDDVATARNLIRINQSGIGFSQNGLDGPYSVAITNDGHIVADFIDLGTLNASIIKAGVLADASGKNYLNMESGAFNLADKIWYDPTTNQFRIDAALLVDEISGTNLKLSGKNITLDGNTTVLGTFSVPGSSLFGTIDAQTIRIKNQDLSEFVRGFLDTPTFSTGFNTYQPATMKGSSIAYGANSSYIQMRDTGGRGQIIANGTIAVSGGTYFYEMNADGFAGGPSMGGAATLLRSTGTTTQINDGRGGRGFNIGPSISVVKPLSVNEGISIANGLKLDGYNVTRGADGNLKWS